VAQARARLPPQPPTATMSMPACALRRSPRSRPRSPRRSPARLCAIRSSIDRLPARARLRLAAEPRSDQNDVASARADVAEAEPTTPRRGRPDQGGARHRRRAGQAAAAALAVLERRLDKTILRRRPTASSA
jgi:hypothetical protein